MKPFHVRWTTHLGVVLTEETVDGVDGVQDQIRRWVDEGFGEDGDQIYVTELPITRRKPKRG